jgi:hypothetical protein
MPPPRDLSDSDTERICSYITLSWMWLEERETTEKIKPNCRSDLSGPLHLVGILNDIVEDWELSVLI